MYKNIPQFFTNYITKGPTKPETWLKTTVSDNISNKIETIIDFGCGTGRNFLPFIDNYKCIGFDIHPPDSVQNNSCCNFTYYQSSIEDFKLISLKIDWSKCLIMTHGTLMYCKKSSIQNEFIKLLRDRGCENFIFHEYASDLLIKNGNLSENARQGGVGYLNLNDDNLELFNPPLGKKINFRDDFNDLQAHICLKK